MEFTSDELQLASTVRELAHSFWQKDRNDAYEAAEDGDTLAGKSHKQFTAEFAQANGLAKYIPKAMKELESVAAIIRTYRIPAE